MSNELHVIFGSGPLAQATMRALLERNKSVKLINRSGARPANLPAKVEVIAGDASNTDFTRSVTRNASVVYQCAQPAYHKWVTEFPPLQSAILEGAVNTGVLVTR